MSNRFDNFEQIKDAVNDLIANVPENGVVDLQPLFFRLTFETTLFLLFGQHLPSLKSEGISNQEGEFSDAFNTGQDYLAQRGRLGEFYWIFSGPKFRQACRICHDFVDSAVKKALEYSTEKTVDSEKSSYTFIDALIQETRDPKALRDQCLNILLAGRDTTACCLTWTM
jgi:cytochrome P450